MVVISDLDTTKRTTQITLYKPDPIPEGTDVKEVGWLAANFALLAIGLAVMGVVLFSSFRVLQKARAPLEEHNSLSDYTMTVEGWSGEKMGIDQLPSADDVANSMYGGSQDLFKQPPPPSNPMEQSPLRSRAQCPPNTRERIARGLDHGAVAVLRSAMARLAEGRVAGDGPRGPIGRPYDPPRLPRPSNLRE